MSNTPSDNDFMAAHIESLKCELATAQKQCEQEAIHASLLFDENNDLKAKLARIEAAGRELPEEPDTKFMSAEKSDVAMTEYAGKLLDAFTAQKARADELQTMFRLARVLCLVNGCRAETFDAAIDEALKERT